MMHAERIIEELELECRVLRRCIERLSVEIEGLCADKPPSYWFSMGQRSSMRLQLKDLEKLVEAART